jgi:hypothetical protein
MGDTCRTDGRMRNVYKLLIGQPKTSDHGETGIDGRIILK